MSDVAKLAGVGTMTVSRVLNGTANVSEEASERVYRAIKELHYKPNQLARALRGSRTHTIGVIVPYLYDPFFATCAHAIGVVAKRHSYSVILTTTDESPAIEYEEASQMLRRQVDGLVLIPAAHGPSRLTRPEFRDLPIVTLDRPIPRSQLDSVLVENEVGTRLAVEHLIGHGHRQICFIGLAQHLYTMKVRFEGYRRAMHEAGLTEEAYFDCTTEESVTTLLKRLMRRKHPPRAIFAANGLTTRFTLQALAQLGIPVPQQVAIIAFDDFELADLLQPALTVVRQPTHKLGQQAAELLFSRLLNTADISDPRKITLPVELIVRNSFF